MNDSEGFLSRWSRRKHAAAEQADRTDTAAGNAVEAEDSVRAGETVDAGPVEQAKAKAPQPDPTQDKEPAVDLFKLPPIESITATTDIRPFLAAGVPAELTRAALRRAWIADPKIRDFIEVAENQFDFNAGTPIPGFDLSPPTGDLKRMVADVLGRRPADSLDPAQQDPAHPRVAEENRQGKSPTAETPTHRIVSVNSPPGAEADAGGPSHEPDAAEHNKNRVAGHQDDASHKHASGHTRRGHGGAMPR